MKQKLNSNKRIVAICILVVIVLCLAVGAYFLWQKRHSSLKEQGFTKLLKDEDVNTDNSSSIDSTDTPTGTPDTTVPESDSSEEESQSQSSSTENQNHTTASSEATTKPEESSTHSSKESPDKNQTPDAATESGISSQDSRHFYELPFVAVE